MQKVSPFLDNGQTLRLERILKEVQLEQETLNYYRFTVKKCLRILERISRLLPLKI